MCNCIKKLEQKLNVKMKEEYPGYEVSENARFQNTSYLLDHEIMVLTNPILGKVKKGGKIRKFERNMIASFCPFCGEKIKLTKKQETK